MHVRFICPRCEGQQSRSIDGDWREIACDHCDWSRPVGDDSDALTVCLICGCPDLWKQKDFPHTVGLGMVALGVLLSTIAWAWYLPGVAIGILMVFALIDFLLYMFMPDVLVCYRCRSRYRTDDADVSGSAFDLETAERYRQQKLRLEEAKSGQSSAPAAHI